MEDKLHDHNTLSCPLLMMKSQSMQRAKHKQSSFPPQNKANPFFLRKALVKFILGTCRQDGSAMKVLSPNLMAGVQSTWGKGRTKSHKFPSDLHM